MRHYSGRDPKREHLCCGHQHCTQIESNLFSVIGEDPLLWHKRLGHASFSLINTLRSTDLVRGLPSIKFLKDEICDPCAKGKHVWLSFKPKNVVTTLKPLELIHMDLCGPMRIKSRSGK